LALVVLVAALVPVAPAGATITAAAGKNADGGNAHIVVARDDGSHQRSLGAGDDALISPDGTRVAVVDYPAYTGPGVAIFKVLETAGGPPVFTMPARMLSPIAWAPDSRTLVASDGRSLLTIDAATGARATVAHASVDGASFSPDSKKLAYATQGGTLKVVDLATGTTTTLRRHAVTPLWGRHGIAFSATHVQDGQMIWNVARMRADGSHVRRLTHIHPTNVYFGLVPSGWSDNGRRLATVTRGADGWWRHTYVVNAVRGGARLLADGLEDTTITPNGRWIVGQTGDPECCGFALTNIVRVPWRGGRKHVLIRHAMSVTLSD
jgi:Tol biopolymer transport system component